MQGSIIIVVFLFCFSEIYTQEIVNTAKEEVAFTDSQKEKLVQGHNEKRRAVSPAAANMKKMIWDAELAKMAQSYSRDCTVAHSEQAGIEVGENVYIATSKNIDNIIETMISDWNEELVNFNDVSNECKKDKICGHYKQMIWAKSDKIGCGVSYCPEIDGLGLDQHLVVCNYKPAGNLFSVIGQEKVYMAPYVKGEQCTQCESGYSCDDGLCGVPSDEVEATESTVVDASAATGVDAGLCYQQNKKIIDTWQENMRIWREEDMVRWRKNMDKYEATLENNDL